VTVTLYEGAHIVAATLLTVLLIVLVKGVRKNPVTIWNVAFLVCALAYYIRLLAAYGTYFYYFANAVEYLAPVCFIACVRINFRDQPTLGKLEKVCFSLLVLLLSISTYLQLMGADLPFQADSTSGLDDHSVSTLMATTLLAWVVTFQMLLMVFCVFAAFGVALQDWSTDLVAKRRSIRRVFIFVGGPVILSIIALHTMGAFGVAENELVQTGIVLFEVFGALVCITFALHIDPDINPNPQEPSVKKVNLEPGFANDEPPPPSTFSSQNDKLTIISLKSDNSEFVNDLETLMSHIEQNQPFKEMGLKLEELADQLLIPEYRIRQAINKGLGYRNFNAFLNKYRIEAATDSLANPQSNLSILDISIESGFKSLSSFNKSFKLVTGKTPTEYRKSLR
jgi:AraC-like DNA-binding protein